MGPEGSRVTLPVSADGVKQDGDPPHVSSERWVDPAWTPAPKVLHTLLRAAGPVSTPLCAASQITVRAGRNERVWQALTSSLSQKD